jgi:hypothetical protein
MVRNHVCPAEGTLRALAIFACISFRSTSTSSIKATLTKGFRSGYYEVVQIKATTTDRSCKYNPCETTFTIGAMIPEEKPGK